MDNKNFYELFGISPSASNDEVREAYKRFITEANKKHKAGSDELKQILIAATAALYILTNPDKRFEYNQKNGINPRESVFSSSRTKQSFFKRSKRSASKVSGRFKFLLKPFIWLWDTVWVVVEPILKFSIRAGIILGIVWGIFLADETQYVRDEAKKYSGPVYEYVKTGFYDAKAYMTGLFKKEYVDPYNTLACEKVRLKYAEAEKIYADYQRRLEVKDSATFGYTLGKLLQGKGGDAVRGLAEGSRLTARERHDLEKAEVRLKTVRIDNLECFR